MSKYWFRKRQGLSSKDGGWGWVPISWQGWLVIVGFLVLIILNALIFSLNVQTDTSPMQFIKYFVVVVGLIALVVYIARLKTRP